MTDGRRTLIFDVDGTLVDSTYHHDVGSSKPAPDVVKVCWERPGRGSATVVGDTVYDVLAARALALPCIAVRTGGFGTEELEAAGAILVVDDLDALVEDEWSTLRHRVPPRRSRDRLRPTVRYSSAPARLP